MRLISYTGKLSSKIYFVKLREMIFGPYSRKPTSSMVGEGKLIIFELNEEGNYIQQK